MSKKSILWLVVLSLLLGMVIFMTFVQRLPWWGMFILIFLALLFLRIGCWGGKLEYQGKPLTSLPDYGKFKVFTQRRAPSGFVFLLSRIGSGHETPDYYEIGDKILNAYTKKDLEEAPDAFAVHALTDAQKTIYLFAEIPCP